VELEANKRPERKGDAFSGDTRNARNAVKMAKARANPRAKRRARRRLRPRKATSSVADAVTVGEICCFAAATSTMPDNDKQFCYDVIGS
jgi:hypothetical protein